VDLWWSGKHDNHAGNIRVVTAPDGWPLGYEGGADTITVAFKKPKNGELSDIHKTYNKIHNGIRAIGERGNSLLKMTFKALRNVSLGPWTMGRPRRFDSWNRCFARAVGPQGVSVGPWRSNEVAGLMKLNDPDSQQIIDRVANEVRSSVNTSSTVGRFYAPTATRRSW
jgi:hypothetical protein